MYYGIHPGDRTSTVTEDWNKVFDLHDVATVLRVEPFLPQVRAIRKALSSSSGAGIGGKSRL